MTDRSGDMGDTFHWFEQWRCRCRERKVPSWKNASVSLPALASSGSVYVTNNLALAGLGVASLTAVNGNLFITDNVTLPQCLALALKDRLIAATGLSGSWTITGNDVAALCP